MKHQIQNEAVQIMHYAGTRLNLEDVGGAIRNPQSAIRNPQSAIRNPQSAIRNPRSKV
jgi:major type 1 subunit fimbrin (pilin)